MQSNVTTVEIPKCVSAAVELPRESGLPDLVEERVGITNTFLGSHDRPKFRPDRSDLQVKIENNRNKPNAFNHLLVERGATRRGTLK
ncbi:hypothetical protein [Mesorhizobium sp. M0185]|uniref:hypothetical protein n=1 Tax=Mesorhizobium sp. M0185 TaxID=2956907 RepID=UPI003338AD9A